MSSSTAGRAPPRGGGGMPAAPGAQLDAELVQQTLRSPAPRSTPSHTSGPAQPVCPPAHGGAAAAAAAAGPAGGVVAQPYDVYVVLDFEATCEAGRRVADPEVIEFPMVLVDGCTATPVAEFQRYVRPVRHPALSAFCTELTDITQGMVQDRDSFPAVYREALQFLADAGLGDAAPLRSYCVVTCGDWDLKTMLPAQLKVSGRLSTPSAFQRWCNLKKFMGQLRLGPGAPRTPSGLHEMLQIVGLSLQGRHHSGIDDCRNIAAVLCALLRRGHVVTATSAPPGFAPWHASSASALPPLTSLTSSLADGGVADSAAAAAPPLSQARVEHTSALTPSAAAPASGSKPAVHRGVLPALDVDESRDAVAEVLAAPGTVAPRPLRPEQLKTVSKFMSTLLRHKALQWRVPITANGFVLLDDLLLQPQLAQKQCVTVSEVAVMVRDSDKQRFRLVYGAVDGRLYITAAQGHSMDGVEPALRRLTRVEEVPVAVHGTYWDAWKAISACGYLSTMTRQHIHFAKGLVNDAQVISGMRANVQLFIYLDVAALLADGVPLYESANGVILTPGVADTRQLPLRYVAKVVDRSTGRTVYPA